MLLAVSAGVFEFTFFWREASVKGVYSWGILLFAGYRLLRLRCEAETVQGCSRGTRSGCGRAPEGSPHVRIAWPWLEM